MALLLHGPPEALIAVLSAFDTDIYIAHVRTNPHVKISALRNTGFSLPTDPPPPPPPPPPTLGGSWKVAEHLAHHGGEKKGRERERAGRGGEGKGEGGEAASSVSSEIGGARVTKALFLCRDRETKEQAGAEEKKGKRTPQ